MTTVDFFRCPDDRPDEAVFRGECSYLGSVPSDEHWALQEVFVEAVRGGVPFVHYVYPTRLTYWQAAYLLSLLDAYEPKRPAHASRAAFAAKLADVLRPAVDAGDGVVSVGP